MRTPAPCTSASGTAGPPPPDCAAVLVNYFCAADTAAAARSVLDDAPATQVLVVDNSADGPEHARLRDLLPRQARLIDAGANLGFGRACNLAFGSTDAPFVFFVNPDVRLAGGNCTAALVRALCADATLAAVGPRQFLDSRCQWHLPPAELPTAVRAWVQERALRDAHAWQRMARAVRAENLRLWTAKSPLMQRALSGGALMLRRAALAPGEEPFDARFFMYYEDSDLCLRLRRAGWRMAVVPAARAIHAWRNAPHKSALMHAGAQVYFGKHWPARTQDPWLRRADKLAENAPAARPFCASHNEARVSVPCTWQGGWLLELSPSPLLQPCTGLIAAGAQAWISHEVLQALGPNDVHVRLSPVGPGLGPDTKPVLLRLRT